jgi:hypothetical protein
MNKKPKTYTIHSRAVRFAAVWCAAIAAVASPSAAEPPKGLLALYNERTAIAQELARPIAACVARFDTDLPAFHGCADWHSSVSGVWALIAYSRMANDRQYDGLVQSILTPEKVAAERKHLAKQPQFELPYGRAWLLRLALEYKLRFGDDLLAGISGDVFDSLMERYKTRKINPSSGGYDSDSWALINMYDYARSQRDEDALQLVKDWITKSFAQDGAVCKASWEGTESMAVCANWAWLASRALSGLALRKWADAFFRSGLPKPITAPKGRQAYGLNFSRAWGLWRLYQATGDNRYADAYVAHFREAYGKPGNWRDDHRGVAHWTPQFGMFALQPLFTGD